MTHFSWQWEGGYLVHLSAISAPRFLTEYNQYPQAAYPSRTTLKNGGSKFSRNVGSNANQHVISQKTEIPNQSLYSV